MSPGRVTAVLLLLCLLTPVSPLGINATHIVVGNTGALSGPARIRWFPQVEGMRLAFREANAAGGILARNLSLISLDDGYEPARSIENFNTLNEVLRPTTTNGNIITVAS